MSPVTERTGVFSGAKVVENTTLNRAGIQPFRAVLARLLFQLRPGSEDPLLSELTSNGVVLCHDFLPHETFTAVRDEAQEYMAESAPTWLHEHGTTEVRHFALVGMDAARYPHLSEWRHHTRVQALASGAERRNVQPIDGGSLIEHITIGDYHVPDPQTDLHVDTFFNTHKLWLYLDDVRPENAPFVYVRGSHRLDRVRLREEYQGSVAPEVAKSRRIGDDELAARGLQQEAISCPANTLMIANTCGYHARSVGTPGATRLALHKAFRFNPFNPFTPVPGQPSRLRRGVSRLTHAGR